MRRVQSQAPSRKSGRHVLAALTVLFILSASVRFGERFGFNFAFAAEDFLPLDANAPESCGPNSVALAAALSQREGMVLAQETVLAERAAALDLATSLLEGRLEELALAEAGLRKTLALADGAAEEDLKKLTQVYENMKPREAALLFDAMEPQFAAGFLGRMRAEAAADILTGMSTERGYAVSAILAGRNSRAPRN